MAERYNRDPTYDLGRHIATGEKVPLSGDPVIQKFDQELDRNDPMDPFSAGHGDNFPVSPSDGEVSAANIAQAAGLSMRDIGTTHDGGTSMQMDIVAASDCLDEPTKGGIAYGPRFTGERGY